MFRKNTPMTKVSGLKTLMHGNPKIGKSTAYSKLEGVWFIATERGYNFLECEVADAFSWQDAIEIQEYLITEKPDGCKGVVIDTINNLAEMCEKHYCSEESIEHLSEQGFGKGYSAVKKMLIDYLITFEKAGLSVHMISHSKDREMKSKVKTETIVGPDLSEGLMKAITAFCDQIFFAYVDVDGHRKMRTKPTRNIIAGDRSSKLPELMDLDLSLVDKFMSGKAIAEDPVGVSAAPQGGDAPEVKDETQETKVATTGVVRRRKVEVKK